MLKQLTKLQEMWLNTRGGRNIDDVFFSKGNAYYESAIPGGTEILKIPYDKSILKEYRVIHYDKKEKLQMLRAFLW